jgi:fucose permease
MKQNQVRIFVFMSMVVFSLSANTIAPLMTSIQEGFGISVAKSSIIPLINTIGVMTANIVGSFFIAQIGIKNYLSISYLMALVGSTAFVFSENFIILLISVFFIGASTGAAFTSLSTTISHLDKKYQNFGMLNAFFGVGGIIAPMITTYFLSQNLNFRSIYLIYLFLFLLLLIYLNTSKMMVNIKYDAIKFLEALNIIKKRLIIFSLLIFLFYSGTEISVITWAGNLFVEMFDYTKEFSSLMISYFWITFTAGRFLTDWLNRKFTELNTIIFSSVLFFISLGLILIFKLPYFFIIVGLAFGPVFPSIQKYANQKLPSREVGMFNGLSFASTGLGAMIISTSMGVIADFNMMLSFSIPYLTFSFIIILSLLLKKNYAK